MVKNVGFAVGVLALVGCFDTEPGERGVSGCPDGEVCSPKTPDGLRFSTLYSTFDQATEVIGPVALGGDMGLSFSALEGELGDWEVDVNAALRLESVNGNGLVVNGAEEGLGLVRVVDPTNGELYDRLPVDVVAVDRIELVHRDDPERTSVRQGCTELVRLLLISDKGEEPVRVYDDGMEVVQPTVGDTLVPGDVYLTAPPSETGVELTVRAGGRDFTLTVPVVNEPCPTP